MEAIIRCKKCIVPLSLPSVKIDKEGVCNHCREFERLFGNWSRIEVQKKNEFEALLLRAKKLNRKYDCLIPLSGGKDSTYVVYLCSKVYNIKCLCVTFDNGFLSEHAKFNITNAIKLSGADHIYYTVNRKKLVDLYKLFIKKTGTFCPVCMRYIDVAGRMLTKTFNIPVVVSGNGRRISYLAIHPELFQAGHCDFVKNVLKNESLEGNSSAIFFDPLSMKIEKALELLVKKMKIGISNPLISHMRSFINIYDYIYTPKDEIIKILTKEMGWTMPENTVEHMDCLLHDVPLFINTIKFKELTPQTLYHSGLIRQGLMSREEALKLENTPSTYEHNVSLNTFLEEIGINRMQFNEYVGDWKKIEIYRSKAKDLIRYMINKIRSGVTEV